MLRKICSFITKYMAVIVLVAAAAAFLFPTVTKVVRLSWVTPMLGCVMFGMGLTLNAKDFAVVFSRPRDVLIGIGSQFVIMPALAFFLVKLFNLPAALAVGVLLVGCCPGGTSSNVITFLSKGDLALSVGITACSTLLSPVVTPLLFRLYAGSYIAVNFLAMFLSIVEVIIIPIAIGLIFNRLLPKMAAAIHPFLPAFSVTVISLIVIAVVSANSACLHTCGLLVVAVVLLHNILGYATGYAVARAFRMNMEKTKALSIEVGMQNSGLACSLAATHFQALSMASIPGAVFSVWHNISGALIARFFTRPSKQ